MAGYDHSPYPLPPSSLLRSTSAGERDDPRPVPIFQVTNARREVRVTERFLCSRRVHDLRMLCPLINPAEHGEGSDGLRSTFSRSTSRSWTVPLPGANAYIYHPQWRTLALHPSLGFTSCIPPPSWLRKKRIAVWWVVVNVLASIYRPPSPI